MRGGGDAPRHDDGVVLHGADALRDGADDAGDGHAVDAYDGRGVHDARGAPYGDGAYHDAHDGVPPYLTLPSQCHRRQEAAYVCCQ